MAVKYGWEVVDYILGKKAHDPALDYTLAYNIVPAVAYGRKQTGDYGSRFGVKDPVGEYKKHLGRIVAKNIGYEIIKWFGIAPVGDGYTGVAVEAPILPGINKDNTTNTKIASNKGKKTNRGKPKLNTIKESINKEDNSVIKTIKSWGKDPHGNLFLGDDKIGYSAKIHKAQYVTKDKNSMVIGNTAWNMHQDKYLTDDWGVYCLSDVPVKSWTTTDGCEYSVYEGNPEWATAPENAIITCQPERTLNPNYDESCTYISREDRPEWNIIGLLGQVQIATGQITRSNWIKMCDISDDVQLWLIR